MVQPPEPELDATEIPHLPTNFLPFFKISDFTHHDLRQSAI